jgi:hypothetical protein
MDVTICGNAFVLISLLELVHVQNMLSMAMFAFLMWL